ncbi:MAG TPA: hypothetical protein V6D17_07535, partial [Candidatus Obscuribacterales bacterium]
ALKDVKARNPKALVLATPVIAEDTYFQLLRECDMLVALETPRDFVAVGQWFHDFHQVSDEEVVELLRHAAMRGEGKNSGPWGTLSQTA